MPRKYNPAHSSKNYRKHSEDDLKKAAEEISKGASFRKTSQKYCIPVGVLHRYARNPVRRKQGGQTILSPAEEQYFISRIITCADWGYPLTSLDLRLIIKAHFDRKGQETRFKDNLPTIDWVESFLRRHKDKLSKRLCQNIKRSRAKVSPEIVTNYFNQLKSVVDGVPASHILNYDETNLKDDPGSRRVIVRRGCKHPERVINHSKSSTSIMYCATADGKLFPPYVCYKAMNLYGTWCEGGPKDARYNRSKSGWFDSYTFEDWFDTVVVPYVQKLPGKKVIIGDNLACHLTASVIQKCEKLNVAFSFLPTNSTDKLQPLDVAVFKPFKTAWRQVVEEFKLGGGANTSSIPKDKFPSLLKKLHQAIEPNVKKNISKGFAKTGIFPFSPEKALSQFPSESPPTILSSENLSDSDSLLVDYLKQQRYGKRNDNEGTGTASRKRRKIDIPAGSSISSEQLKLASTAPQSEATSSNVSSGEQEDEAAPVDEPAPETNTKIQAGDYVVVIYNGVKFPGTVSDCTTRDGSRHYFVSVMYATRGGYFWPATKDELWYSEDEIMMKLDPPAPANNRGIWKFPAHIS